MPLARHREGSSPRGQEGTDKQIALVTSFAALLGLRLWLNLYWRLEVTG